MTTRQHYTALELTRFYLHDLVTDIRCARRDDMPDYAQKVTAEFRALWTGRHTDEVMEDRDDRREE
jgi:hypothetical protein